MNVWQKELVIFSFLLMLTAIGGFFSGHLWLLMFMLMTGLLIYQTLQIDRFEKWISTGGKGPYPKAYGIWEEIYYHIYRSKKNEKKRKKKLGKMVDQFRKSTEALPDAAVVLGANDEIEWVNKMARQVLGLQQTDKGQRIPNLIRFPEFIQYLKSGNFDAPITLPSPVNKNLILAVRIIEYGEGLRLLLAQDVTQLKKMESMRKDFVANVSHELRTPLTVLKGYLETLQDLESSTNPILHASIPQMQAQTDRMQHLVDDLLLLNRLETQQRKIQCVNVPHLLGQICRENIEENQLSRIQLTVETPINIIGDEIELHSAFINLISNALKYSPDESPVNVRWYRGDGHIILDVQDQGEGIPAFDIPRVTERFYRCEVKRDKKIAGTGLGLAIVKHVLLRHDAKLQIRSQLGKGSTFSCCFLESRIC